ncbi:hypothetical protein RhiLY_12531 [Ceratobasidium sp. AG-Ba]|nr:hypothetical protein RhiLY_12531 [Ceratobasidium sp. AG-Ba]
MGQVIARATGIFSSPMFAPTPIHTPIPTPAFAEVEIHTGENEDGAEEHDVLFPPQNPKEFVSPLQKTMYGIHGIGHFEEN